MTNTIDMIDLTEDTADIIDLTEDKVVMIDLTEDKIVVIDLTVDNADTATDIIDLIEDGELEPDQEQQEGQ